MNGDIFETVDWMSKLLSEGWYGYYLVGISQSDDTKNHLTSSRIVGDLKNRSELITSAYIETAKLLNSVESVLGLFGNQAGFVTLGWKEPIFNYVTSLVAYWSIINNEYPSVKVSRIFSNYDAWQIRTNQHPGPEFKSNLFVGNRMFVETTLGQGGSNVDLLKWDFFSSESKRLQEFLEKNTGDLFPKVQILSNGIRVQGSFEFLNINFSGT